MSAWGSSWGSAWSNAWGQIAVAAEVQPTGGWGGESQYYSEKQRRKRKKERLKALQQEIRNMNRWR